MKNYYSDVVQFTGSHYDFGYMQGEQLKNSPILTNRERQWKTRRKYYFTVDKEKTVQLFSALFPQILDEIQGLADALDWSYKDALREFGGYYLEYTRSGCTILTTPQFMVRNYDSQPVAYEGRYVIYKPTDTGYATIGPSMQITGRTDGMNEKGLVMGYNFVNRRDSEDGFVCNMVGRMVLEMCANVDEAIALLEKIPHRTSFNYALLDASGESVVVEASPRKVIARKSTISTNHFEVLGEENRYRMEDSIRRQEELLKKQKETLQLSEAYELLTNETNEVFATKYGASAGTIHTTAYIPKERKALFSIGNQRMPVFFNFDKYLSGERVRVTKIKGVLDYHLPFVNMK